MGAMYEYTGVVKEVFPLQTFSSGFTKREVCVTDDIGQNPTYPNLLYFGFKKDRTAKLNNITPGMRVKIVFAIDGREWADDSGNKRHYTDLVGIKLDVLAGGAAPGPQKSLGSVEVEKEPDDIPF